MTKRSRLMAKKNRPGGKKKGPGYKKKVTWWQRGVKVDQVFSLRNDNVDCQKMGPKLERLFILACRSMLGWVITACIELMNEKHFPPFMTQWPWPSVYIQTTILYRVTRVVALSGLDWWQQLPKRPRHWLQCYQVNIALVGIGTPTHQPKGDTAKTFSYLGQQWWGHG